MARAWLAIGAVLLALGVSCGAFGAHILKDRLDPYLLAVFEKAVLYHLVHAAGILCLSLALSRPDVFPVRIIGYALCLLLFGVIVFSGSLYALALTNIKILGAITPIGGLSFIIGWLLLAWGCAFSHE